MRVSKAQRLTELLDEAVERGFNPTVVSGQTLDEDHPHITYKCAQKFNDQTLYFMPYEVIPTGTEVGGQLAGDEDLEGESLTDGHGGYILYKGRWAENTTPSFVRKQKLKKILSDL